MFEEKQSYREKRELHTDKKQKRNNAKTMLFQAGNLHIYPHGPNAKQIFATKQNKTSTLPLG